MFSFPKLADIYKTMTAKMNARFSHGRAVETVKRFPGRVEVTDEHGVTETFSQIVICSNADKSLARNTLFSPSARPFNTHARTAFLGVAVFTAGLDE